VIFNHQRHPQKFNTTLKILLYRNTFELPLSFVLARRSLHPDTPNHSKPEPVEYVPGWQGLQEPAPGAPANTMLQDRAESKSELVLLGRLQTGLLPFSSESKQGSTMTCQCLWILSPTRSDSNNSLRPNRPVAQGSRQRG
jgi:hypothetical protein